MAQTNPTTLTQNLRFFPKTTQPYSRSPSRSPQRKAAFSAHELDPLLSNLSPDSTLDALTTTEAISPTKQEHDILSKSIGEASPAERAFGIRAAVAAQKLREWCAELSTWQWPNVADAKKGKGFVVPSGLRASEPYLGSLPKSKVTAYDERVEEVKDSLEALDVDGLKQHVLDTYNPQSAPQETASTKSNGAQALSYVQLRDFTAIITATIVQALPFLAKLTALLAAWDARLIVLWQVQSILNSLRETRNMIEMSWEPLESEQLCESFDREQFLRMRDALADSVAAVGGKFDRALDTLEGREDALPERWIEDMDAIETDFASWVVEAERLVLYNEWIKNNGTNKPPPPELLSPTKPIPSSRASPTKLSRTNSMRTSEQAADGNTAAGTEASGRSHITPESNSEPQNDQGGLKRRVSSVHESVIRLRGLAGDAYTGLESPVDPPVRQEQNSPAFSFSAPPSSKLPLDSESTKVFVNEAMNESPQAMQRPAAKEQSPFEGAVNHPIERGLRETEHNTTDPTGPGLDGQENSLLFSSRSRSQLGSSQVSTSNRHLDTDGDTQTEKSMPLKRSLSVQASVFRLREMAKHAYTGVESPIEGPEMRGPLPALERPPATNAEVLGRAKSMHGINSYSTEYGAGSISQSTPGNFETETKGSQPQKHAPKKLEDTLAQLPRLQPPRVSHRREISNISMADSIVSDTLSDLSNAEIVDASTAEVVGSPIFDPKPRRASVDLLSAHRPMLSPLQTVEHSHSEAYGDAVKSQSPESANDRKRKALSLSLVTLLPKSPSDGSLPQSQPPWNQIAKDGMDPVDAAPGLQIDSEGLRTFSGAPPINKALNLVVNQDNGRTNDVTSPFSPSSVYSRPAETPQDTIAEAAATMVGEKTHRPSFSSVGSASSEYSRAASSERQLSPPTNPTSPPKSPPAIPRRSSKRKSRLPQLALFRQSGIHNEEDITSQPPSSPSSNRTLQADTPTRSLKSPLKSSDSPSVKASPRSYKSPKKTVDETLDEKISDILTTIPMKIRLATDSDPADNTAKDAFGKSKPLQPTVSDSQSKKSELSSSGPASTTNSTRSPTPTPSLTLAPARRSKGSGPSFSDTDVRLYHLSRNNANQAKDAAPMKLFVRLVGDEPQRVMVRVGGGWADLAEYLREYAVHHGGSRRISGNKFDVQNLPDRRSISPVGPGPLSRTSTALSISKVRPPRPASALDLFGMTSQPIQRPASSLEILQNPRRMTLSAAVDPASPSSEYSATPTTPTTTSLSIPGSRQVSSFSTLGASSNGSPSGQFAFDFGFNQPKSPSALPYTPLGAAGPKLAAKSRTTSSTYVETASDEKWVDDMVSSARRSSGRPTPVASSGRKASGTGTNPGSRKVSAIGSGNGVAEGEIQEKPERPKAKNRMSSLEKIGGIRRVFLKKKDK
ncbi:MAG: hypothetical protein Q9227_007724 [Pyrenula ochraceoflavens]